MTKSELIKRLAQKHQNVYAKDISIIVNTVLEEISQALINDDRVELRGFGSFSIRERKSRVARNPRTNEKVQLGRRRAIYFRAGKEVRERINKNA
ncbi:MAG: integration host factor subunit beta [Hyphomicrobiales bacterium]|nr:integration host factor subunit beta [Rickettsiales bacterium]MCP5361996.1 integration host factor subunit beta [Hyphomicrobiales bacterium]